MPLNKVQCCGGFAVILKIKYVECTDGDLRDLAQGHPDFSELCFSLYKHVGGLLKRVPVKILALRKECVS